MEIQILRHIQIKIQNRILIHISMHPLVVVVLVAAMVVVVAKDFIQPSW